MPKNRRIMIVIGVRVKSCIKRRDKMTWSKTLCTVCGHGVILSDSIRKHCLAFRV